MFDECRRVGEIEFQFADKEEPLDYTVKLAGKMQLFETEEKLRDILKHEYVIEELDRERIQETSALLADPKNVVVFMRSKTFEEQGICTLEDPWYHTKYSKEPLKAELIEKMTNPSSLVPEGALGLPPPNTLLPKNLDLVSEAPEHAQQPTLLKEWPGDTEVWFMKDDKFKRPKAIVNLKIYP